MKLDINELLKGMQEFLHKVCESFRDGSPEVWYTTDEWFEEFGISFLEINGFYVDDENIICCI